MMLYAVIVGLLGLASALLTESERLDVDLGDAPMQNPDLFGGDMLGIHITDDRNIIRETRFRWTRWPPYYGEHPLIPYIIMKPVDEYKDLLLEAMEEYHNRTCVRFVPKKISPIDSNYVSFFSGRGCYSHVGMKGGFQEVSLGRGCMFKNTIIHELGHVLGLFHEHNRSDRDKYLDIHWKNINPEHLYQFFKLKTWEETLLGSFDYNSIMLYSNTSFAKDRKSLTMTAKDGTPILTDFEKPGLSEWDVKKINSMYNCRM